MIIVKNRELLIPNNERYIGTTYDNETENRVFQVPRFSQRGVDLAALTFRLDIQYANEAFDTVLLDKEVGEAFIILIWRITSATLQVPGTLYIGLRAIDDEATVKWSSFSAAMYAERHLNTPGNYGGSLTEIEQIEQDHQYMKGVVDELKANIDYAHDAEAWAQGTRSGTAVPSTDKTYHKNSKYYSEQASAKATQAANSATAAANSATQAAETVADTNARFNNAMEAVTSETEVIDARVGADGTTYPVLKSRLDAEHTQLNDSVNDLNTILNYTGDEINIDVTWEGYYYIYFTNGNKISISETAASVCILSNPISIPASTNVKVNARLGSSRSVIALVNPNGSYTPLVQGTDANHYVEYTYTATEDCNIVVCTFGKLSDSRPDFYVRKKVMTSRLDDMDYSIESKVSMDQGIQNAGKILVVGSDGIVTVGDPYNDAIGVKNGGALNAYTESSGFAIPATVELYISLANYAENVNKWFYGVSTATKCAVGIFNGKLRISTNVGDYSYQEVNYLEGNKVHLVLQYSYDDHVITKRAYVDGAMIAEAVNNTNGMSINDAFSNFDTIEISVYHKRIWNRILSASEIATLYNNGDPSSYVLTPSIKAGIVSNLSPEGLYESGWHDSVQDQTIALADGAIILRDGDDPTPASATVIKKEIYPEFDYNQSAERMPHDCTFIGDDFVTFNQPSDGGGVKYINPVTWELLKTIHVMFTEDNGKYLQNKSVDYKFEKLLIGNGRAIATGESSYLDQGAKLYVFHSANTWKNMSETITFSNCGNYDVIDISSLGYKTYGFWGASEDLVFVSCNLFNDVFLIRLGKGTNELSYGTYVAAENGRYNGSYDVIKHWHQDGKLGNYSAHGGQYYNGYLYLATNNDAVCTIYRCNLDSDGSLSFDALNFLRYGSGYPNTLACKYIDGVCIHNGTIYAQPLIKENNTYSTYAGIIKMNL